MIKWWVATAVVVGILGSVGVVHAESGPYPDTRSDAGCFGGLPAAECMTHSECEGPALCYANQCDCTLGSCEGSTTREHCDDQGCFCEDRPSCMNHSDCNMGVLCIEGLCSAAHAECAANPQLIERCEGELCHCERRPSCTAHTDCGGVLCNEGQCSNLTECPRGILEFCHTPDRCLCRRPGWACVSHAGCGNGLCVDLRCSGHLTSCNTPPYQTFCGPQGCRCERMSGDAGGAGLDAGLDAGMPNVDGGRVDGATVQDAGPDGGVEASSSGCGCHTAPTGAGSFGWLVLGLLWIRRRR